jgi:DNA-binding response OmpR family regulator
MNRPSPKIDRGSDTLLVGFHSAAAMADDVPYDPARVVLVVEDDWLLRQSLVDDLASEGWTVLEAESGESALKLSNDDLGIGLLITDIRLGGRLNGWDVAEAMRQKDAKLAVIYISANSARASRQVVGSIFLSKPYLPSQLLEACRAVCGPMPQ